MTACSADMWAGIMFAFHHYRNYVWRFTLSSLDSTRVSREDACHQMGGLMKGFRFSSAVAVALLTIFLPAIAKADYVFDVRLTYYWIVDPGFPTENLLYGFDRWRRFV